MDTAGVRVDVGHFTALEALRVGDAVGELVEQSNVRRTNSVHLVGDDLRVGVAAVDTSYCV